MATRITTAKPQFGKRWSETSQRTKREWEKKYIHDFELGRTKKPSVAAYYFEQKNSYWIPRARKLVERLGPNAEKRYYAYTDVAPNSDAEARLYVLSGGSTPGTRKGFRTAAQNDYFRKYKASRAKHNRKKAQTREDVDREIYS